MRSRTCRSTSSPARPFAIIGPNGAGKSTIFNLISRLYEPTQARSTMANRTCSICPRTRSCMPASAARFRTSNCSSRRPCLQNLLVGRHATCAQPVQQSSCSGPAYASAKSSIGKSRGHHRPAWRSRSIGTSALPTCRTARARTSSLHGPCAPSRLCCSTSPRPVSITKRRTTSRSGSRTSNTTSVSRSSWWNTT